jgi:hypothetical protein
MCAGSRGNATARHDAWLWSTVFGAGLSPRRWICLEVPGRKSGRLTRTPQGMPDVDGRWYVVSMLGEDCRRVGNARAAGGHVLIRHGRARRSLLVEVPVQ